MVHDEMYASSNHVPELGASFAFRRFVLPLFTIVWNSTIP
jgi:hypothetical protein